MKAGDLRHRVTIQRNEPVTDSFGTETEQWVDVVTVWASVEPLSGREFFQSQKENAETTVRIKMRYRSGITSDKRVKFGDNVYEINAVIDIDERHIELHLMCRELV